MATKNPAIVEYGEKLVRQTQKMSDRAIVSYLGPIYRGLKSIEALSKGKLAKIKPLILFAFDRLGIDEMVATSRTFVMLVRPIRFPADFEKSKAVVPELRKKLVTRYGAEAVRGRIRRKRVVTYKYVMEDDLRKRIEADDPLFRREVSILMGATPELRTSDIPDRVKEEKKRKGR